MDIIDQQAPTDDGNNVSIDEESKGFHDLPT
jgi:flagellar basal body rod protein FlgB